MHNTAPSTSPTPWRPISNSSFASSSCIKSRTVYIPADFVTMRTGGASTSGLKSHLAILRDHRRALKTNRVASALPLLCLRYVYKVGEVICSRLRPTSKAHS